MIEVLVPKENVNDETVSISVINFKSGTYVQVGAAVVGIETSKTNIEVGAPISGYLIHELTIGDEVGVGELLFCISENECANSIKDLNEIEGSPTKDESIACTAGSAVYSRKSEFYARSAGLNLDEIEGKWITVDDVKNKIGLRKVESKKVENDVKISYTKCHQSHLIRKFSKRKLAEIASLQAGNSHSITSTIAVELNWCQKRLVEPPFLFSNGIADLVVYEASRILVDYPELNAFYLNSKEWVLHESINFGWSFDSGKNLKVLAIPNANTLSLCELQSEVQRLFELYESGKEIPVDILTSSTVTLSDLSGTDAVFMLPLLNSNQSLILGLIKLGVGRYRMYATFDHRIAEGLSVTRFLSELTERVGSHFYRRGHKVFSCDVCGKTIDEEISDGNRGFIKIMTSTDCEQLVCRNCFDGW